MNKATRSFSLMTLVPLLLFPAVGISADWPMWRADSGRTAQSVEAMPKELSILWQRQLPALRPAYRHHRLQFDGAYEPIIAEGRLFIASSLDDSVSAYEAETGRFLWRFYTNGPVRFAPVAYQGKLYFGSDDGLLYCLKAADGHEIWRFRAVPSTRTLLGNRRVISVWPIRGGPVLADDTLYFAAGVWPFEGVFIYALDPKTGAVKWLNDQCGHIYGVQPHNARAIGGITPQGYLLVNGDELIVPCSAAAPARFNRHTGELIHFELPRAGREPGGWFSALSSLDPKIARDVRRGKLSYDSVISGDRHEDRKVRGEGSKGLRSQLITKGQTISFSEPPPGIEGKVRAMVLAQGRLFVSTAEGQIYALGEGQGKTKGLVEPNTPLPPADVETRKQSQFVLGQTKINHGLALVLGAGDGKLIEALIAQSSMRFLVIEDKVNSIARLRQRWTGAGLYGSRVTIRHDSPTTFRAPPYVASLILCETPDAAGFGAATQAPFTSAATGEFLNALHPYGGIALLGGAMKVTAPEGASIHSLGEWTVVKRAALPGSSNYSGDWKAGDQRVRAPLGVLWFDDAIGHFKRSPQPLFVDGVMISQGKDWSNPDQRPYSLLPASYTDVYTGQAIAADDSRVKGKSFVLHKSNQTQQPSVYRPAHLDNNGKLHAKRPKLGRMVNPLNGQSENRTFPKSYGCDGGIDYGQIISMRSGTAAFYDKRLESGTIHISGPRSGCTNSIIPANGLLNLPYFYEGCSCSYPLPVGLSMVSLPETQEQWATYGEMSAVDIGRVGLNFGAPGDRMTESGTLWLDVPSMGGPSPLLRTTIEPATAKTYYNHALWINGGQGWPWVAASGIRGIRSLNIAGLRPGVFTLRLYFAETEKTKPGQRAFDLRVQGKGILKDFDPLSMAGAAFYAYVHEVKNVVVSKDGVLRISFQAKTGETMISGIELGTPALPLAPIVLLPDRGKTAREREIAE